MAWVRPRAEGFVHFGSRNLPVKKNKVKLFLFFSSVGKKDFDWQPFGISHNNMPGPWLSKPGKLFQAGCKCRLSIHGQPVGRSPDLLFSELRLASSWFSRYSNHLV